MRYAPARIRRARPDLTADTLYVVGGLYGNLAALAAIERLAAAEQTPRIVFNGDFHWFDAEPDWFAEIERGVARHRALRGNVETEIARDDDIGAGCGCAYPETVDDGVVRRSNEILAQLRDRRDRHGSGSRNLPMHLVAQVGDPCASASCMAMPPRSPAGVCARARSTIRGSRRWRKRHCRRVAHRRVCLDAHLPGGVARFHAAAAAA